MAKFNFIQKKNRSERFNKFFSGNRICSTKIFKKPIPRYTKFNMIDPLQTDQRNPKLLEIDIVVYHEGHL